MWFEVQGFYGQGAGLGSKLGAGAVAGGGGVRGGARFGRARFFRIILGAHPDAAFSATFLVRFRTLFFSFSLFVFTCFSTFISTLFHVFGACVVTFFVLHFFFAFPRENVENVKKSDHTGAEKRETKKQTLKKPARAVAKREQM